MSFEEWKEDYGLKYERNYSKETEMDCKAAYEAGAASRQAEVDELQAMYEKQGLYAFELQKRIDNACRNFHNAKSCGEVYGVIHTLRGKENEN